MEAGLLLLAWSLVWDDGDLISEEIETWDTGPAARDFHEAHRGKNRISCLRKSRPESLNETRHETIDAVFAFYGHKPLQWRSDLTHMEVPWQSARRGIPDGARGNTIIPKEYWCCF
ncbi:MAG: hypothetical protein OXI87_11925 [Albidovulum sp.]|nr:hypothetical protein [Albidovulum sp.]MDE0534440.1 hypothetical protein [Albidovulum sp.]